jgi:hypothetical protein
VVLAPSLLHKSSMTKKRVKFGLAILGALTVFLLALLALVFAPTGASAGKGPVFGQEQDGGGQHPNLAYFEPPAGNLPHNDPGHSDSGVGPCIGPLCDTPGHGEDDSWHYAEGPGGQGGGNNGDNNQGNSPNPNSGSHPQGGNGYPPSLFVGGYPGGYPGGGYGAPQGQSGSCVSKKDKDEEDKESGDKTCDSDDDNNSDNSNNNSNSSDNNSGNTGNDAGYEQTLVFNGGKPSDDSDDDSSDDTSGNSSNNLVSPDDDTDDDLPPVDPNCFPFTEGCDTHNGNPPITDLTDPPSEVPEPLTLSLFVVGLTGAAALRRRSRQKTVAQPD